MNPLVAAAAALYDRAITARNRRFDRGEGVVRFDRPVVSIGNLSVGGTGKTPMVRLVVERLRSVGADPCIAMRGYGASRRSDGRSDEADEYAASLADLPIVARANRTEGLIELFGTERGERVDCVVLDDGFQHRRIARDLDIVLLDATRDPADDRLLPAGRLREPMASLIRAHAAVITHAERAEPDRIERMRCSARGWNPDLLLAVAQHAWRSVRVHAAEGESEQPVSWLARRRVFVACAIGNPEALLAQAHGACREVAGQLVLRDHDPFDARTVRRLRSEARDADAILVTGKDWAKLAHENPALWPCPVVVPTLEMALTDGAEGLLAAIDGVAAAAIEQRADRLGP
ncbi:MAG: tetraacyldisaccharide 4'-kinase [Phycisphaerales bacterium]